MSICSPYRSPRRISGERSAVIINTNKGGARLSQSAAKSRCPGWPPRLHGNACDTGDRMMPNALLHKRLLWGLTEPTLYVRERWVAALARRAEVNDFELHRIHTDGPAACAVLLALEKRSASKSVRTRAFLDGTRPARRTSIRRGCRNKMFSGLRSQWMTGKIRRTIDPSRSGQQTRAIPMRRARPQLADPEGGSYCQSVAATAQRGT